MSMLNTKLDQRGLLTVSLDNPPVNALSRSLVNELNHLCDDVQDETVRMVVISAGGEHFCAGADLKEMTQRDQSAGQGAPQAAKNGVGKITECLKPVIAAIDGYALAGGMQTSAL